MCQTKLKLLTKRNRGRNVRDVMGININDYINTLRVNEFRRLLNDKDVSLEEAVERAGFQSMRTAYRCYKAVYGSTPRSK